MKINWRYTIGEILIVIIGITTAYSLNNWKEASVNKQQRNQYFENLKLDVEQEIVQLNNNTKRITDKINKIKQLRPYMGQDIGRRDTLIMSVFDLAQFSRFYPENTTYQTLINSGDFKLIEDFNLRRNLEEHYALHQQVLLAYERLEQIHRKYLGDFFIHEIDYDEVRKGNTDFMDRPILRNILSSLEGAYYLIINANGACIKSNESLLEEIEKHIGD